MTRTRLLLAALLAAVPAAGQARVEVGAQALPMLTHAAPVLDGEARTEATLSQPMLMAGVRLGALRLRGMLNLEALTLPDGEPGAGIWGEGFVDRRHPHTLLHELAGTVRIGQRASLTAGRGFVPFGSDDPMARPFAKYPLNHHLAQVLERLILVGEVRAGQVRVEGALFNGDEPVGTGSLGRLERFADSWALRGTLEPLPGVELAASHARVASPEQPSGGGLDQRKTHASLRWERSPDEDRRGYALLEWARSEELNRAVRGFRFHTLLAEGALRRRGRELGVRLEQTERPDEERLENPFRTPFPHADVHLLGITRWRVATLALSQGMELGALRARPFAEGSMQWVRALRTPAAFVPREFYGGERLWSITVGARLAVGADHPHRPGRYGPEPVHH